MCTEAGLLALRERRMCVTHEDFKKAKEKVLYKKKEVRRCWRQLAAVGPGGGGGGGGW